LLNSAIDCSAVVEHEAPDDEFGAATTAARSTGGKMGIEGAEETIGRLRTQLGREPTQDEVRAIRDELIRKVYAAMAVTDLYRADDRGMHALSRRPASVRPATNSSPKPSVAQR
jgi:hypothetical protein